MCTCTYLRPVGLRRLLEGLTALEVPAATDVEVVIVDNDPARSAEPIVDGARAGFPFPLRYVAEPERGIVAARNAAVAAASAAGADAVAFIDDDEWPSPAWLRELVGVGERTGSPIVTGTVLPVFDEEPPAWVRRGRFFDRPRHADGERIRYARTSNVLIGAGPLAAHDPPFADTGSDGGEDTHFFARARAEGHAIAWADDATVFESVPTSRVDARWLVLRQYRYGLTRSAVLRQLGGGPLRMLRRVGMGGLTVLQGVVLLATVVRDGRAGLVRGAGTVALGVGLLLGLFGVGHDQYRTVHGS